MGFIRMNAHTLKGKGEETMRRNRTLAPMLAIVAILILAPASVEMTRAYFEPCKLPPVVTQSVRPNVMMLMDYSGSMQLPSYYGPLDVNESKLKTNSYQDTMVVQARDDSTDKAFTETDPAIGYYDLRKTYVGVFEPDKYYIYQAASTDHFFEETTAPSGVLSATTTEDSGPSGTLTQTDGGITYTIHWIEFTAAGHAFAPGDVVVFKSLSSHQNMNEKGYEVIAVNGDAFRVATKVIKDDGTNPPEVVSPGPVIWNGTPDKQGATIRKRVKGNFADGLNGNVLNFAATSRLDAVLKILIGGRSDPSDPCTYSDESCYIYSRPECEGADPYCFTKGIAGRIHMKEETALKASFYLRPAQLSSSATFPDDYNDSTYGNYLDKTSFLSVKADYAGEWDAGDPAVHGESCEAWKFSTNGEFIVNIKLSSTVKHGDGARLVIYNSLSNFEQNNHSAAVDLDGAVADQESSSEEVTLSARLPAGDYYLRVTIQDGEGAVSGSIPYDLSSNVTLSPETAVHQLADWGPKSAADHDGVDNPKNSPIGALPFARIKVKTLKEERRGLIQDVFQYVRLGFQFFSGHSLFGNKETEGKILYGLHEYDPEKLINAFQGVTEDPDYAPLVDAFTWTLPWGETPTAEALDEVYNYFEQHTNSQNADNTYFTCSKCGSEWGDTWATEKDPYYSGGSAVACRKSFAILVSDGASTGNDPANNALRIHADDLRKDNQEPDLPGEQVLDVYAVYAFSTNVVGASEMKTIAMAGAFKDDSACSDADAPYPYTSVDTSKTSWPINESKGSCDPDGQYDDCCSEWDTVWDRDEDGILEQKGLPDTYFEARDGTALLEALKRVFDEILVRTAAASAVATISQEVQGGDIILRGAFQAADPRVDDTYFWFGHVEAYWPFMHEGAYKYAFQLPCNADLLCHEMPGVSSGGGCSSESHCWDAATFLTADTSVYSADNPPRRIWSWLDDNFDSINDPNADADGRVSQDEVFELKEGNWDKFAQRLALAADCDGDTVIGSADESDVKDLIKWWHGQEVIHTINSEDVKCFRERLDEKGTKWLLGDIVYSTPVVVGTPSLGAVSIRDVVQTGEESDSGVRGYWMYRNSIINELKDVDSAPTAVSSVDQIIKKMVYVGANDGMLHAFIIGVWDWHSQRWVHNPNDPDVSAHFSTNNLGQFIGRELWAFVPSNLISELPKLAKKTYGLPEGCPHRNTVDLSPQAWHVFIDHDGDTDREWRTVLVGGERGGGDVFFAIDITDPDDPQLLWEYSVLRNYLAYAGSEQFEIPAEITEANYEELKQLPLAWSKPRVGRLNLPSNVAFYTKLPSDTSAPFSPSSLEEFDDGGLSKRHVAFMGGGFRVFDVSLTLGSVNIERQNTGDTTILDLLRKPYFMAIDIETGENLFRYFWPYINNEVGDYLFPIYTKGPYEIPYAFSDPSALDLWTVVNSAAEVGADGYVDHIYVGDLTGYLWGFKFVGFERNPPLDATTEVWVDLWTTKAIEEVDYANAWSHFRSLGQPITVEPAVSIDEENTDYARIVFGAGKFDDVSGENDDKTDPAKTSIYNLKEKVVPDFATQVADYTAPALLASNLEFKFKNRCSQTTMDLRLNEFNTGCTWFTPDGADCCESDSTGQLSCADACWSCVLDLVNPLNEPGKAGERVTNKALIAAGLVFITTYAPPEDPCVAQGKGYLYILDYMCGPFPEGLNPVQGAADYTWLFRNNSIGEPQIYGIQVDLGVGMPSAPVLDSSGQSIIVQMSNADLIRIEVDLPVKRVKVRGWREER
jgi:hypothetical protein